MKKRALVISFHFFPDASIGAKRPTELAKALLNEGWDVDVICRKGDHTNLDLEASQGHGEIKIIGVQQPPKILDKVWVKIKRFKAAFLNTPKTASEGNIDKNSTPVDINIEKTNFLHRIKKAIISSQASLDGIKAWLLLSMLQIFVLRLSGRRYALVLSSSPPAAVHLLALFTKKLFDVPLVLDFRDPINMWDDALEITKCEARIRLENWLADLYFKNANLVVTTTEELMDLYEKKQAIINKDCSLATIYNGYDGCVYTKVPEYTGTLKLAFAGQLYGNRNPFPLFNALKSLVVNGVSGCDDLKLYMYGNFESWEGISIPEWLKDNGLMNSVVMKGFYSKEDLAIELRKMHVLVSFAQRQPLQIPAKTFEYLVYPAKNLVVSEIDSATGRFVSVNELGYVCEDDESDIEAAIQSLVRDIKCDVSGSIIQDSRVKFSRSHQNSKYVSLLESLGDRS